MPISYTFFNGQPATSADLSPLAFAGYAHFTAMQVRDRAVRRLDLHLDRLRHASHELFGQHLPDDTALGDTTQMLNLLHQAYAAEPPIAL